MAGTYSTSKTFSAVTFLLDICAPKVAQSTSSHTMNSNGTVGSKIDDYDWTSGWTQAKPFTVGSNTYLFLLKEGNGNVHMHCIKPTGLIGPEIESHDWSSGWTSVDFYSVGGNTYLFLLKKSNGIVHIHEMT